MKHYYDNRRQHIANYFKHIKVNIIIPYIEIISTIIITIILSIITLVLSRDIKTLFYSVITGSIAGVIASVLFSYISMRSQAYYWLRTIPWETDKLRRYLSMYKNGMIEYIVLEDKLWDYHTYMRSYYHKNFASYIDKKIGSIIEKHDWVLRAHINKTDNITEFSKMLEEFNTDIMNYLGNKDWVLYR